MNHAVHNKIVSFIWSIADDCLRDVYVRGKYRDVILPMVVLRRLDSLLEPAKDKVMEELAFQQNELKLTELEEHALESASGYVFRGAHGEPEACDPLDEIIQNRDLAFEKIFSEVMLRRRRDELELSRLLASDVAFCSALQQSLQNFVN